MLCTVQGDFSDAQSTKLKGEPFGKWLRSAAGGMREYAERIFIGYESRT